MTNFCLFLVLGIKVRTSGQAGALLFPQLYPQPGFIKVKNFKKRCQKEAPEIKYCIEFINFRNDLCEERVSETESTMVSYSEKP